MARQQTEDFLNSLANDPNARNQLHDALVEDIVDAGKKAGYDISEEDVNSILTSMMPGGDSGDASSRGTSIGWS